MAKLSWCQMSIPLASLFEVNYALQPTPGHSRLMQPVPDYSNPLQATPTNSNPLQATPTNSNPLQATPTNSSHFNPFHAVLTHCRPLHLLQTTLEIQPHPILGSLTRSRKFLNFISFLIPTTKSIIWIIV